MPPSDANFDFSGFDNLERQITTFPQAMKRSANTTWNQVIRPRLLVALRKTPKRRFWGKADFVNDASRRAFFAKTKGKAYQRTGELAAGWETSTETTDASIQFNTFNRVKYRKFVTGNQQVFGHKRTGWPQDNETFETLRPIIVAVLVDAVTLTVKDQFTNG